MIEKRFLSFCINASSKIQQTIKLKKKTFKNLDCFWKLYQHTYPGLYGDAKMSFAEELAIPVVNKIRSQIFLIERYSVCFCGVWCPAVYNQANRKKDELF